MIGKLLLEAESTFKEFMTSDEDRRTRGRPSTVNFIEVLAKTKKPVISEAGLRDSTYVAMAIDKFPILSYVNEPVCHFTSALVRSSINLIEDALQESMVIPETIKQAYSIMTPYVMDASELKLESLSPSIPIEILIPNDGDGFVELKSPGQLQDAISHRFFAVDAPELYSTHFINTNGQTIKRRNGHLAHLAVHYYQNRFCGTEGTGSIRRERPINDCPPTDKYQRQVSSFWFVWLRSPTQMELDIIDEIRQLVRDQDARSRMMSSEDPRNATCSSPFFLSLNALLVVSGFCHVYTR